MIKKLIRHGNSMALILDKPVLDLLRIDVDTPIEIFTDGTVLVLSPVRDPKRKARFQKALTSANRRFGRALRKLAE